MAENANGQLNRNGNRRGMSPNSRRNLALAWKANNHAKKDRSITSILKEMANDAAEERWLEIEDKGKGLTWRQAAAKRIWIEAVRGNAKVTSELLDRLEGKVTLSVKADIEGEVKQTFNFIMPDGAKLKPSEFVSGNSD